MGKGKKRKAPPAGRGPGRGGRGGGEAPSAPNPFERLSSRKRFDILGRKVKGDTKQMGKLRSEATERRKDTLLVEYRQLRKSNAFVDRRFGEDDDSLTADEKALLRFQKQRMKEAAGSKFALPDDDGVDGEGGLGGLGGEGLTHMGRSLAGLEEMDDVGYGGWGSDDEGPAGLDDQLTRDLHFGGGLFERKAGGGGDDEEGGQRPARKSKKEVMEEIIAKSKAFKAEKQRQREDDADETTALDDQFRALLGDKALLAMMRKKGEKRDSKSDTQEDKAFDVLTRELVFEAKAQPGERTLTGDEAAEAERQRLEALEAARRRRQEGEEGGSEDEGEEGGAPAVADVGALPAGGYAARRAKRARRDEQSTRLGGGASGDALEDDWATGSDSDGGSGSGSDEEGSSGSEGEALTGLERRRQQRAAGAHPLQEAFREQAAQLLKKHRRAAGEDVSSDEEEEEEGDDDDEEDEEEGGSGSGSEEELGSDDGLQGGSGSGSDAEEPGSGSGSGSEDEEGSEGEGQSSEEEEEPAPRPGKQQRPAAAEPARAKAAAKVAALPAAAMATLPPGVSPDLPFTPPLPASYEAFAELAEGRSAADLGELVRRIRVVHAPQLNADHRQGLQLLYGLLVQHFASLAGALQGGAGGSSKGGKGGRLLPLGHLDALLPHLVEITQQVPFYAATLARARLAKAQERLAEALRDPVARGDAWPPARVLLLLKLWATVFPASDKRHPVLTPASLLACSCLSNCPLARPHQAASGLYLASLALHLHSQAQRYVPEPLAFAVQLLQGAVPEGAGPPPAPSHQRGLEPGQPRWLAVAPGDAGADALPATPEDIQPLDLGRVMAAAADSGAAASDPYWRSAAFKASAAAAAVRLVQRSAELLAGNAALPELLQPALDALRGIVEAAATHPQPAAKKQKRGKAGAAAAPAALVAPGVAALAGAALEALQGAAVAVAASRRPMVNVHLLRVAEKRSFNPRFEEGYVQGKDYDPDRERSERRKLQRSVKREERGAARELRRDAAFMADVRDREKASKQAELFASEQRAKSFLQAQATDLASGGQGGMWKKKGGKRK